ncbi:hypothetical protein SASPL_126589 [Salvia splendens]|uniref:Uncharacterized protein n=1 Tax=Salvia splendens TaxID=180675 RepID=A0A8X8XJS4_SALSN|nr:hypothetical protein SASPL_126589 [Salvia splendens]
MERTPPRKRGRLKRSTTSSMGKGKDAAGTPSRIKPSASHKRKPAVNEGYNHWKHSSSPCFMIGSPLTILPGPLSPAGTPLALAPFLFGAFLNTATSANLYLVYL